MKMWMQFNVMPRTSIICWYGNAPEDDDVFKVSMQFHGLTTTTLRIIEWRKLLRCFLTLRERNGRNKKICAFHQRRSITVCHRYQQWQQPEINYAQRRQHGGHGCTTRGGPRAESINKSQAPPQKALAAVTRWTSLGCNGCGSAGKRTKSNEQRKLQLQQVGRGPTKTIWRGVHGIDAVLQNWWRRYYCVTLNREHCSNLYS